MDDERKELICPFCKRNVIFDGDLVMHEVPLCTWWAEEMAKLEADGVAEQVGYVVKEDADSKVQAGQS